MQTSLKTMLISLAALVAASAAVPAVARDGGAVEALPAYGVRPPQVFFAPSAAIDPEFAALDRMEWALEQQAELILREAASLQEVTPAMLARLPQGTTRIVVSTFSSNGACSRSTQISYAAGQAAPRTISSTSGNCGPAPDRAVPAHDVSPDGQRIVPAVWER